MMGKIGMYLDAHNIKSLVSHGLTRSKKYNIVGANSRKDQFLLVYYKVLI